MCGPSNARTQPCSCCGQWHTHLGWCHAHRAARMHTPQVHGVAHPQGSWGLFGQGTSPTPSSGFPDIPSSLLPPQLQQRFKERLQRNFETS